MALWLDIRRTDESDQSIPMMNHEWEAINAGGHVRVRSVPVSGRNSLSERRYGGYDLERVIQSLREGDILVVKTYPDSYKDRSVHVVKDEVESVIVRDEDDGKDFHLIARYWGERNQGDGQPWMRTALNWESRGEIEEIEILALHDHDE